ncbi:MAG: ECF transporter S component [Lachnospiraceae bacterium]|nr:ECF transporter S component [Lachnospiraceae bacterium]
MNQAKTKSTTFRIVIAGLLAALTCVATMLIRIPTLKGYIHIGDSMVIASGILLGPMTGGFAAGIGSMLADILSGYPAFSIATLVIKFLAAASAGLLYHLLSDRLKKHVVFSTIFSGLLSEIVVVVGYFVFEIFYEGFAAALAEIVPNGIQGAVALFLAVFLIPTLKHSLKDLR